MPTDTWRTEGCIEEFDIKADGWQEADASHCNGLICFAEIC